MNKKYEQTSAEVDKALRIGGVSNTFICRTEPKVTFINELWIGKVKVPVKTELDFSNVHESQHEKVLKLAQQIYFKDRQINGC